MPNSLAPAFIKIEYASAYGPHAMILPTLAYTLPTQQEPSGTFLAHDGVTTINAEDMVNDLLAVLDSFAPDTTSFQNFTVYTKSSPTASPLPRYSQSLSHAGADATPGYSKAVQMTVNARTENFGAAKLVLLDAASNNLFDKVTELTPQGILDDLITEWTRDMRAWAGRDNGRPATFISQTWTLNEKLRRAYRVA